jgi:transporter family-2 protein
MGLVYSVFAGLLISFQCVFNARLGEKVGPWQANLIAHATGLALLLTLLTFKGSWNFEGLRDVNKLYLIAGMLGVFIVFFITKSVMQLGANYSLTIIIVVQLMATALINHFGWFQEPVTRASLTQNIGLLLMLVGVALYQLSPR